MSFKFGELKFIDVPVPYFGEGAVIRVNQRAVKHTLYRARLANMIDDMKDISLEDRAAYITAAGLMSVCTTVTGEPAFSLDQLDDFTKKIPGNTYFALVYAHLEMNPDEFGKIDEKPMTLPEKKRKSSKTD